MHWDYLDYALNEGRLCANIRNIFQIMRWDSVICLISYQTLLWWNFRVAKSSEINLNPV